MSYSSIRVFLLCWVLCLTACAVGKPAAPPVAQWTREIVASLTMELIDPIAIEWMSFTPNGYVATCYGRKGGWITAPAFEWRLDRGRLQIVNEGQVMEELTFVSRDASTIVARRRDGQLAKYKVLAKPSAPK